MENSIIFNKDNRIKKIRLNPENSFFKITRMEISSIPKFSRNISSLAPDFKLTYRVEGPNNSISTSLIAGIHAYIKPNHAEAKFDINEIIAWNADQISIEFEYELESEEDKDVVIFYTQFDKKVELKDPFEDFDLHFRLNDNTKILFSAPFGQGKTTFLNHFFDTHQNKYEVFKIFPVNYAVSHNEDIFKYIKAELLFQLLEKDVEFEKIKFTFLDTAPAFFKKNVQLILSPFISLLPVIGKSASDIYEKIYKLATEYMDYHKKIQIDDKDKALQFIHALYEKEGSVFEDNFYTQLIRQLLEQHKEKIKKQIVLVIDDIDRMDPDHIFRIFNVFAANFDTRDYINGYTNKFGFDKIILVCDHLNIKNLFAHRYGSTSEFTGYLSKYYSKKPYEYDNNKAIDHITKQILQHNGQDYTSTIGLALLIILKDLIYSDQLSLRDLLKLLSHKFYSVMTEQGKIYSEDLNVSNETIFYFNIIGFLNKVFDSSAIVEKFKRCSSRSTNNKYADYNFLTLIGFVPISKCIIKSGESGILKLGGETFTFKLDMYSERSLSTSYYKPTEVNSSLNGENIRFQSKDFWNILILNAEKYRDLY